MNGTATQTSEWRRGWPLALSACAGMTLASLPIYTMGVLMAPLEQAFGWSRAVISSALTVNAVIGVLLAPFIGIAIDRIGPRRIALVGLVLFSAALATLSLANGSLWQWYANWVFVALGAVMLKPTVWTAAVASRFSKARGLAMAVALCGSPVTATLAPQAADYLLSAHGWRGVYVGLALIWAIVVLPLLLLFFYGAIDLWRREGVRGNTRAAPLQLPGVGLREAFTSTIFVRLAVAALLITSIMAAAVVHLVPLLTMRGIERHTALFLMSVLGVAGLAGRLLGGTLLDRMDPRLFGTLAFALPSLAFLGLLTPDLTFIPALAICIVIGLGSGAEIEVSSYLSARYFGLRNYGAMFGTIAGLIVLGAGLGPPLAGLVYDRMGSYDLALWVAAPIGLFTGLLIFSLPRKPAPEALQAPEPLPEPLPSA